MPDMNVRGDQHLNFTPTEAAAWLGEVRQYAPHVPPADVDDGAIAGVLSFLAFSAIITLIIGVAICGLTRTQTATNAPVTGEQASYAVTRRSATREAPREEAMSQDVSPPIATVEYVPALPTGTSENIPSPVAYMPAGWFYARMQGALPLRTKEGRSMGAVPDGATFFATTAESAAQIIVASDGSYWGYGELTPPENAAASPIPIIPAFEKAAERMRAIEAFGITNALYMYNRQAPEEAYLPAGWSMGDLAQDQPLTNGVNGARIGTIKQGTRLLFQITNVNDWRLVVSADGSSFGYACIRSLRGVEERTPMRPECRGGVALIHRLEHGSGVPERDGIRQALAENSSTPTTYGGEEQ